jgi:hypothetical protein
LKQRQTAKAELKKAPPLRSKDGGSDLDERRTWTTAFQIQDAVTVMRTKM